MNDTARRAGWRQDEIDTLTNAIKNANQTGEPLRGVFVRMAQTLARKPDSIRNFYYAQLKKLDDESRARSVPFKPFQEEEMRELLRQILQGVASGKSVRSCVTQMAQGDKSRMLRYQNKYRNLVKSRPDMVEEISEQIGINSAGAISNRPSVSRTTPTMWSNVRQGGRLEIAPTPDYSFAKMQARQDMLLHELNIAREHYYNLRVSVIPMIDAAESLLSGVDGSAANKVRECVCAVEKALIL
ncbi:MAG: hypothetical protein LBD16_04150 [Oscillospiraceae bacterium]|jgi:hypothetical protein|nr:hypothetical protein [Oscillospiraceae bacterium]